MSWTADQIYTLPKPDVITFLKDIPCFNNRLYWVKDLDGIRSEWTIKMMNSGDNRRHHLPQDGILVIAPHIYSTGYDKDRDTDSFWTEMADNGSEKWSEIDAKFDNSIVLPGNLSFTKSQINLFGLLQTVSKQTNVPFCYYKCEMWGGDIDEEYSIVFNESISIFVNDIGSERTVEFKGDIVKEIDKTPLQLGLDFIGLTLPTWFFALHEGSFNWKPYQIK